MTKNIILTLVISGLATFIGFTSCNNKNKVNQKPSDTLMIDSVNAVTPDTAIINQTSLTDSSWNKAAELLNQETSPKQGINNKSGEITIGQPKPSASGKPNPFKPQELLDGIEKAKNGDFRGAITDFDRCLVINPNNYNAYFYKAKALIELNEPENAINNFNRAIEYNPANPVIFYHRGKLLYEAGNTEKAYADFDKAVSLNPEFPDALNYRGVIKELQGKHAEAIEDYKAAIKISPNFSTAYYNQGTSEAAMELYKDAVISFSKCIEIDPRNILGFMNRGNCYVMLKEYDAAVNDYSTAISIDPKNSNAYYNRGAAYQLAGNKNSCADWIKAQSLGDKRAGEMLKQYCK